MSDITVSNLNQVLKVDHLNQVLKVEKTETDALQVNFKKSVISANITQVTPELTLSGFNTIIQNVNTNPNNIIVEYEYLTDDQGRYIYHAKAYKNSQTDQSVWRIFRIDTNIQPNHLTQKADDGKFTQIWDNRYTLNYI